MTEAIRTADLAGLFEEATAAVQAHQREINELDGYNGNHGDNMVKNVQAIASTLRAHREDPPAEALKVAGQQMAENGAGGTSQFYAQGLQQAAERFSGKSELTPSDGMTLIQTLLGAIPTEGYAEEAQRAPSVLDFLTTMSGGASAQAQPAQAQPAQPDPQAPQGAGLLEGLLGMVGQQDTASAQQEAQPTQTPQTQGQQPSDALSGLLGMLTGSDAPQQDQAEATPPEDDGFDLGNVLDTLLPAGLAYLQARQEGADGAQAGQAALMQALLGRQTPRPTTSREAAGTVIAQSLLKALLSRRS